MTMTNALDLAAAADFVGRVAHDAGLLAQDARRNVASPQGTLDLVRDLHSASAWLRTAQEAAVAIARANGATWQDVADSLGVTRQAAQMRYGR